MPRVLDRLSGAKIANQSYDDLILKTQGDQLTAYFPLGDPIGSAIDLSHNGNNPVSTTGTVTTPGYPMMPSLGNARLSAPGYTSVPHACGNPITGFSVSLWFSVLTVSGHEVIISNAAGTNTYPNIDWMLRQDAPTHTLQLESVTGGGGTENSWVTAGIPYVVGAPIHALIAFPGGSPQTPSFWLNGVPQSTVSKPTQDSGAVITIGGSRGGFWPPIDSLLISNVAFWSRTNFTTQDAVDQYLTGLGSSR